MLNIKILGKNLVCVAIFSICCVSTVNNLAKGEVYAGTNYIGRQTSKSDVRAARQEREARRAFRAAREFRENRETREAVRAAREFKASREQREVRRLNRVFRPECGYSRLMSDDNRAAHIEDKPLNADMFFESEEEYEDYNDMESVSWITKIGSFVKGIFSLCC